MPTRRSSSTRTTCGARSCASRTRSSRGTPEPERLAHRRDPPPRRHPRRPRCSDLLDELLGAEVPLGDIDIAFYRDDVAQPPERAGRPRLAHRLRRRRAHDRHRRRRPLHRPHRARRDRGAVRLRPARPRAARRARRPRPPRAADPPRLRRQEPADLARRARQRARRASSTASTRSRITDRGGGRRHEAPALDRGPRPRGHRAHPRPRRRVRGGRRPRDQEGARRCAGARS